MAKPTGVSLTASGILASSNCRQTPMNHPTLRLPTAPSCHRHQGNDEAPLAAGSRQVGLRKMHQQLLQLTSDVGSASRLGIDMMDVHKLCERFG